jgi:uncharacterized protein YjbI with pentapeptide repeats
MTFHFDLPTTAIVVAASGGGVGVAVAITVAAIGAVATVVVGLLNYRMQQRGLDTDARYQAEQLRQMVSAQITDGFTKAIDQLGSPNRAVRIGGIYALERIARESPRDHANIVSTLATFIRDRLPANISVPHAYVEVLKMRAPDAQAALSVLCRSPLSDARVRPDGDGELDLSRTDLRRATLSGAHLQRANLWGARLEGADMKGANLRGAVLTEADVGCFEAGNSRYRNGVDFSGADLTGVDLDRVVNFDQAKTSPDTLGLPDRAQSVS